MENILSRIVKISIYSLVFLLPLFWLPFSFEALEFNKQYLLFFLVSLGFLAWLAKQVLVEKEIRFKRTPLDLPILIFLVVAIASSFFSVDGVSSIFGFYGRFSDGLISLFSLVLLYFLIINNVTIPSKEEQKAKEKQKGASPAGILKAFSYSLFFIVLISYLSIFGIWEKLFSSGLKLPPVMLSGVFNSAAGSLEGLTVFLAIALTLLTANFITKDGQGKLGKMANWLLFSAILVLLIIIDFSAAWIVVLITSVLFVAFSLWKRIFKEHVNRLLLPIFLAVIAMVFISVNTSDLQVATFQLPEEQVLDSPTSWQISFKGATENVKSIFVGSGLGTFHYDFAKFKPTDFNQNFLWQIRFDRAGSYIAEILGTMGFLGLISYFGLIGAFLLLSYFVFTASQTKARQIPLLMTFFALLVAQFVYYQTGVLAFIFWLFLALTVVSWQKPVKEKTFSFKDFPELSLVFSTLLIILAIVFSGIYFFAVRFYLADNHYRNAIGEGAIPRLQKAISFNPYFSQYKIVLARSYLAEILRETQKAPEDQDQIALANNVNLAITYGKGGVINNNDVKGAAEISPNRVATWDTLGMIYRDIVGVAAGSLEWGKKAFESAIELEPANPVLYTELGKLYLREGDMETARQKFQKAKELKPDYITPSIQLALISEAEGNLGEAISQMEILATDYPFNIDVFFQLGRLYFNNNRVTDSIAQFERVVLLYPNHSNAHYSLGVAYEIKGQVQNAIAAFERVLELNPGNQDVQNKIDGLKTEE